MRRSNRRLKSCGRITAIVILMSFLIQFPVFAEQPMAHWQISSENEMKLYSDSEIELLIDDISEIALEAIEKAAAEAAKAAALAAVEREAAAMREATRQQAEALRWQAETKLAKKTGRKNTVIGVVIGILGGLALGVGGTILINR